MMRIVNTILFILSALILLAINSYSGRELAVYIPLLLSIYLNCYYFLQLFKNSTGISKPQQVLHLIFPILITVFSFLSIIDSFTQTFKFSPPYYDLANASLLSLFNTILSVYLSSRITNSKSELLDYTLGFLLRVLVLALPFLITSATVAVSVRVQYTLGAVIIPLFYISISIFASLPTLKMNRESDYGGGYIGQLGGYSANDYRREIILMLINRALYLLAVFAAIVGAISFKITLADLSYVTYDIMFKVLNSFNSTYPIQIMLIIYLAIGLLVIYIFWAFSYTDKFFKDNHVPINIKYLDNLIVRRLVSVTFIACAGYLLFNADHILGNFMHNYKLYRMIDKKLQIAKSSIAPAPILDYSNSTNSSTNNTPRRNLAIIYLESMNEVNTENKYFENLTPTLTKFKDEGIYFANNKQIYGQKNSAAGIFSSQCGRFIFFDNKNENKDCLGNILHKNGYYQEFVQGWTISSFEFDKMFYSFDYDKIYGYDELTEFIKANEEAKEKTGTPLNRYLTNSTVSHGLKTAVRNPILNFITGKSLDPIVWSGYSDKNVFEFAMGEFERLYNNSTETPFVLTVFTADNHDTNLDDPSLNVASCNDSFPKYNGTGGERNLYQVLHCQDELVRQYVNKIREIDKNNNTAIMIIGDHLMHYTDKWHYVLTDDDRIYFTILNSGYEPQKIDYETAHYDFAPIALDILGVPQKEQKENKNITKFMNGFDLLKGLQTDAGLSYMKNRRVNSLFDNLSSVDIYALKGQAIQYRIKWLYGNRTVDILNLMQDRNSTFTPLTSNDDMSLDVYSLAEPEGMNYVYRIKLLNASVQYDNNNVQNFIKNLDLTIRYDNTTAFVHENVKAHVSNCDNKTNYCYLSYQDLSGADEHIELRYVFNNGKIGGTIKGSPKASGKIYLN